MQATLSVEIPENKEINQGIIDISGQAMRLVVKDNESFTRADDMLNAIKKMKKTIEEFFEPHKKNAHKAWRALCDAETAELNKLEPGANHLKAQNKKYLNDQEMIRLLEENRLRLEAQKAEEERRLAESIQLEAEGHTEEAEAVLDTPAPIVMPTVDKTTPKADMRIYRKVLKWRIINEDLIPREYLSPNPVLINAGIKHLGKKFKAPGIELYEE